MTDSVRGRRWHVRAYVPAGAAATGEYPAIVVELLRQRGIRSTGAARAFLLRLPEPDDPLQLPGMAGTLARIRAALRANERIAVYGDYDVDGVTATAILCDGLQSLGASVFPYLPDRFTNGYGLTRDSLRACRDQGAGLIISVDCGINANPEIDYAHEIGLGVVVLDHHAPPPILPDADAIVDPKLGGGPPEYDGLAACGLAYTTLRALYAAEGRSLDGRGYIELAALGTVADMVPLTGENRRIVRTGLPALAQSTRPGVRALLSAAAVEAGRIDTDTIAFRLAPRINAAGRLAHARLAYDLLTTEDPARAAALAGELNELNAQRQRMTEDAAKLARELAMQECAGSSLVMVGHERIPQGIAGLVASRLTEELYRPSVVYERGAEIARGSVRSIPELDVVQCLAQGGALMERWGGHAQAGGFSVRTERLPQLKQALGGWADEQLAGLDLRPVLAIDLDTPLSELTQPVLRWLPYFEPAGQSNPAPVLVSRRSPVMAARTMGQDGRHLRLKLRAGSVLWDAVGWNLGAFAPRPGTYLDIVYRVARDRSGRWELALQDFAPSAA